MVYIISIKELSDSSKQYTFFETHTESTFTAGPSNVSRLLQRYKFDFKNVSLLGNEIIIKQWYNPIDHQRKNKHTGASYIILCQTDKNTFKIVTYEGKVKYLSSKQLIEETRRNVMANCKIQDGKLESLETYKVTRDIQFEQEIEEKYKIYEAKTALLGCRMSFYYIIEGREVKLEKYSGTAKDVIIPNFVTTIMHSAFSNCELETLTLNNGLEYIGSKAFSNCNISEVIIPKTVKFMGYDVFFQNKNLILGDSIYKSDKVKILNNETITLDPQERYL